MRYRYVDGTILTCIEEAMNFKFDFLPKESLNLKYFQSPNNLTTDAALIEDNIIDFPSSSILIRKSNTKNITFLGILDYIELCFVVPKQEIPINYLITQFEIFDFNTTIIFITSMALLTILWTSIELFRSKVGQKYDSVSDLLLIFGQAQNMSSINKFFKLNNRGIIILVVFFYFVICTTYSSIIASRLVYQPQAKEINTLEDVERSELDLLATVQDVFRPTSEDIKNNSIYYRLSMIPTKFLDIKLFFNSFNTSRKTAILTGTENAKYIIVAFYDQQTGRDVYHIVQKKLFKLYRSFMIPKNSPYKERFAELLTRLIESGFVKFEKSDITRYIYVKYINRIKLGFHEDPRLVVIKMEHLDHLINLWIKCMSLATVVFILEIVFNFFIKTFLHKFNCFR